MVISPGINLVPISDDCTRVTGDLIPVWPGTGERCPEGPHILRHGDYYYAILAEGGTGYGHGINVGRSKNLFGPYEASPYNPLMRQLDPNAPIQRTGHGKLIEDANGDWWVYYLMGRPNRGIEVANGKAPKPGEIRVPGAYTTVGRETGLDPVRWLDDGWFVINEGKDPGNEQTAPVCQR